MDAVYLQNELRRKRAQTDVNPTVMRQYVWQREILQTILSETDDPETTRLNLVHWHMTSPYEEVFLVNNEVPTENIYKIITPELEYWYADCCTTVFAGVIKRPALPQPPSIMQTIQEWSMSSRPAASTEPTTSVQQPMTATATKRVTYYHSKEHCASNDHFCRSVQTCARKNSSTLLFTDNAQQRNLQRVLNVNQNARAAASRAQPLLTAMLCS